MRQTIYSKYVNNLLNTTKISYVLKSCFYGGLFIAIKLVIPESPHLTVFCKGSQMLQQNSGYRSNNPSLWSGEHLGSGIMYSTVHRLWLFLLFPYSLSPCSFSFLSPLFPTLDTMFERGCKHQYKVYYHPGKTERKSTISCHRHGRETSWRQLLI